jgi:hypothetical protein
MSNNSKRMNPAAVAILTFTLAATPFWSLAAAAQSTDAQSTAASSTSVQSSNTQSTSSQGNSPDSGLYIKVRLSDPVKMSKLKSGDVVQGSLTGDVYSTDRKLFTSGSAVRLTVDHLEKRKRTPNDHWPWVVNAFTPRHENYPVFKNATVVQDQVETPIQVSMISSSRMREVHAKAKKNAPAPPSASATSSPTTTGIAAGEVEATQSGGKKSPTPTLVLEAFGIQNSPASPAAGNEAASPEPDVTAIAALPAGTRCKILLLGTVSASKSKPGDPVRARLLEPVLLDSKLALPAGTLIEGKVVKQTPPRMLSRPGSLYITFTDLTLPGGNHFPIAASLAGIELNERSHTRMDAEGRLHGERPGMAWMAINLGMTGGISKVADDGLQIVIEALVSTATDVSTAGAGRIASTCASAIYLATRHGRDVVLPRFTEMNISLDRPLSLSTTTIADVSPAIVGSK